MKISSLSIKNYRNLSKISIDLAKDINFIIGENNIGKSNLLYLIDNVLSAKSFNEKDFYDMSLPIEIDMSISLDDEEIGTFDDLCDPKNTSLINVIAKQDNADEFIKFFHKESACQLPNIMIKNLNSIRYDSLRNPKLEIDFSKSKGAAALLNYLVESYLQQASVEEKYLVEENINKLNTYISNILKDIVCFERFNITSSVEENTLSMLSKLIVLKDNNGINLQDTGYGVQFNLLILLSIFDKIVKQHKESKDDKEKEFSCILLFDEPEIHFNPFLQRTLINELLNISEGKDECFNRVVKKLFNISKFQAQIIIATHSRDILTDDYEKIIRMCWANNKVSVVSGCKLGISGAHKKHLFLQFPFVKEAMFARKVLIVEGESEYGVIKKFGKSLEVDFDREGISVIKAGSGDCITLLIELFAKFNLEALGILDGDKKTSALSSRQNLYFTKSKCFDSEIVEELFYTKLPILEEILTSYDYQGKERTFQAGAINKVIDKINVFDCSALIPTVNTSYKFSELLPTDAVLKMLYTTWFSSNKGIILGGLIGDVLGKNDIPECYKLPIMKIKESIDKENEETPSEEVIAPAVTEDSSIEEILEVLE